MLIPNKVAMCLIHLRPVDNLPQVSSVPFVVYVDVSSAVATATCHHSISIYGVLCSRSYSLELS